jgi:hypothetical protein
MPRARGFGSPPWCAAETRSASGPSTASRSRRKPGPAPRPGQARSPVDARGGRDPGVEASSSVVGSDGFEGSPSALSETAAAGPFACSEVLRRPGRSRPPAPEGWPPPRERWPSPRERRPPRDPAPPGGASVAARRPTLDLHSAVSLGQQADPLGLRVWLDAWPGELRRSRWIRVRHTRRDDCARSPVDQASGRSAGGRGYRNEICAVSSGRSGPSTEVLLRLTSYDF